MIPKIVSVDDHVIEPPDLWVDRLPGSLREKAPRMERLKGRARRGERSTVFEESPDGDWADVWCYEGRLMPITAGFAAAALITGDEDLGEQEHGITTAHATIVESNESRPLSYDQFRPGCSQREARLADMDINHVEASLCPPLPPVLRPDLP